MIFHNRKHAGQLLSKQLLKYKSEGSLVFALPRGGVPIGHEVANALGIPLNILLARKVGAPYQPELAVGAVCEDDEPIWNNTLMCQLGLQPDDLGKTLHGEYEKIKTQCNLFRASKVCPSVERKTVIVVDDGLATGATMLAAIKFLKKKKATKIIVAVPVASKKAVLKLKSKVNDFIILQEPEDLLAVGKWYKDFSQVSDEEVISILREEKGALANNHDDIPPHLLS